MASYYIYSAIFILVKIQATLYVVFPVSILAACVKAELFTELPNSSSATSQDVFSLLIQQQLFSSLPLIAD